MIDAAMGLFATMPVDEVTVQDIAAAVDMTPAAVYYHFASKEQILIAGMQAFSEELLAQVRRQLPDGGEEHTVRAMLTNTLTWIGKRRTFATVYFVNSIGLNLMVEALRREARLELVAELSRAVRSVKGRISSAEAGVIAVALASLLETSAASMLNQDAAYRGLGARKFAAEVAAIGDRIVGLSA